MKTPLSVFFVILLNLIVTICAAQIATVSISPDSAGHPRNIVAWTLSIDARPTFKTVRVSYSVQTLWPDGSVANSGTESVYVRFNKPAELSPVDGSIVIAADNKFDALSASQVGRMIAGMIAADLAKWPNLQQ